jgi:hypothetical protein
MSTHAFVNILAFTIIRSFALRKIKHGDPISVRGSNKVYWLLTRHDVAGDEVT